MKSVLIESIQNGRRDFSGTVNVGQKFRNRSECGKLKLNDHHKDYPTAWKLT